MKNKKIIPLTMAIICVTVIGVIWASRLIEANWQSEKETGNTLDNDSETYDIAYLGDFSFTSWEEYHTVNPGATFYAYENPAKYDGEIYLTYEEAAVIGGTALERINKLENFRDMNFILYPSIGNTYDEDFNITDTYPVYLSIYSEDFQDSSRLLKRYQYTINADTKRVCNIRWSINTDEQMLTVDDPVEYAKTIAYDLGYRDLKAYRLQHGEYRGDGIAYRVDFLLNEQETLSIGFNTYNDTFLLSIKGPGSEEHKNLLTNGIQI